MKCNSVLLLFILLFFTDDTTARRGGGRSSHGKSHSSSHSYGSSSHSSGSSSHSSGSSSHSSGSSSHSSDSTSHLGSSGTSYTRAGSSLSFISGERSYGSSSAKQNSGSHYKPSAPDESLSPSYSSSGSSSRSHDWSNPYYHSSSSSDSKPSWSNPYHSSSSDFDTKPSWSNPYHSSSSDFNTKPSWSNPSYDFNSKPWSMNPYGASTHHKEKDPLEDIIGIKLPKIPDYKSLMPDYSNSYHNPHRIYNHNSASRTYSSSSNRLSTTTEKPVVHERIQQSSPLNKTAVGGIMSHPNFHYPMNTSIPHIQTPYPKETSSMPQPNNVKPVAPYPTGINTMPQPSNVKPAAPYPSGTNTMPQPSNVKPAAPYPSGTNTMPQPGHTGNIGFHSSVTHPSTLSQPNVGTLNYIPPNPVYHPQPAYNPHFSQPVYHPSYSQPNHYSGSPQGYYPQPMYQPAQPASGPVIVMAGDSNGGGRGLGDMIKEALVFSTVNAGVNRLINPHHHHDSGVAPTASQAPSTQITYNNYINGQPVIPSQPNLPGMPSTGTNPASNLGNFSGSTSNYPYGNSGSSSSSLGTSEGSSTSNSQTNNYVSTRNGGSAIPAPGIVTPISTNISQPPINPLNDSSLVIYGISNAEIWKLTEDLFEKQEYNVLEHIQMNLQNKSNGTIDTAAQPLFTINKGVYEFPTVRAVRDLFPVYKSDSRVKENRTLERRQKENTLLDTIINTNVMETTLNWLESKKFIDPDDFEKKDTLNHVWFNLFDGSSSGFERVFASETLHVANNSIILGIQDWNTFASLEADKKIDYTGYVDQLHLGQKAMLLKLNYKMNDLVVSNTTILVGTLPELEMALYTICFYARPGIECPVSLGGTKFNIYTHMMPYFGKYLIAAAYPSI